MQEINAIELKRLLSALDFPKNSQEQPTVNQKYAKTTLGVKIDGVISLIYKDPKLKSAFLRAKQGVDKKEQIEKSVLDELGKVTTIAPPIKEISKELNPYFNWRNDTPPKFQIPNLEVDFSSMPNLPEKEKKEIANICMQQYVHSMKMLEHSVGEVAQMYITKSPDKEVFVDKYRKDEDFKTTANGSLLKFANVYSQRYLDLMEGYIDWEIKNNIPMIPVHAGQMKIHGFTSSDILKMQGSCNGFVELADKMERILKLDTVKMDKILLIMTGLDKNLAPDKFVQDPVATKLYLKGIGIDLQDQDYDAICKLFESYSKLPEKDMLNKAFFLMKDFGHLEPQQIRQQLSYVASMMVKYGASKDERLNMEIRHRVGGDMSIHQNSPGTLGGNPLAYLQVLKHGEPNNPEAEFRNKMYFVYMCNHFANAVVRDEKTVQHINDWLKQNKKQWNIDTEFVEAMHNRGASYLPPIFRYGAYANLNRQLRDFRTHHEIEEFYKHNQNISIVEAIERVANINAHYNQPLSARELFNQIGEWEWNSEDKNKLWKPLNFGTGAALFNLKDTELPEMSEEAKAYVKQVNELKLPVYAGISGTLDQSTAMAGLVGLGTSSDPDVRRRELEVIRLAYLAFMLPGRDHSIHEIMQSSATYGLDYVPGPDCVNFIYPKDQQRVLKELEEKQKERGTNMPSYFFSQEYVKFVAENLENEKRKLQDSQKLDSGSKPSVKPSVPQKINYYIGVPLAGSLMASSIDERFKTSYGFTQNPEQNLHMTIGWIEEALTPEQMREISEEIAKITSKYGPLDVEMDSIQLWNQNKDLNLILKERTKLIDEMRNKIKKCVESKGYNFNFEPELHVKIASSEKPIPWEEARGCFYLEDKERFTLNNVNMMHTNPWNWKTQTDRKFNLNTKLHKQRSKVFSVSQGHRITDQNPLIPDQEDKKPKQKPK